MMSPTTEEDSFQRLRLKGAIMDLEFNMDTDHRKRRRNRTTQSCLNCHTSKRKCDRKRPCQRCIQLGLTGLCVYEVDDPALRDDPSLDESTRQRNRIAELESLVRELRGKPHPRWAESFRDGDPTEKWHSRATKCIPLQKPGGGGEDMLPRHPLRILTKPGPVAEANPHLYRFSPSPAPSMHHHNFQESDSSSSFNSHSAAGNHYSIQNGDAGATTDNSAPSSYSDGGRGGGGNGGGDGASAYALPGSYDGHGSNAYSDHYGSVGGSSPQAHFPCSCRSTPALGMAYISLSQALQHSLSSLRQDSQHHPPNSQCALFRKIIELNNALDGGNDNPSYDSGPPSDNEIPTPLSASSGHASFHTNSPGVPPQEWNRIAAAGFNPYFPAVYSVNHVIS